MQRVLFFFLLFYSAELERNILLDTQTYKDVHLHTKTD